ncbi:excalibur calcium-binding domain-containing protein [Kitasatospora sp. NPDC096147]|uniref:excalibur calcium-binding domain-containing protein n=1 Tax=Kitasatospora sp. NPDC096147 TaxID=3364093 RepID=UPI0038045055
MTHRQPPTARRASRRCLLALSAAASALALAACSSAPRPPARSFDVTPYVHRGHVADCDAFRAQADAQAVLRADALDPNGLDRDGDGLACPALPGPADHRPVPRDYLTDLDGAPVLAPLAPP